MLGRVAPHGIGLALGGVSYSVLATFVTLFYATRHWNGAALCLTAFGIGLYRGARAVYQHHQPLRRISGSHCLASGCLRGHGSAVAGLLAWMALAGAGVGGFGLSLVFPAIGVEAVKRVPEFNRGTALGVYTAFADVSFFLVGPVAGAMIGFYGYASIFLFALISVLISLGIVLVLMQFQKPAIRSSS